MATSPSTDVVPDGALASLLLDFMEAVRGYLEEVVVPFGLAPAHAFVLHLLARPLRMGEVAATLGVDPSHVTALVDRLEGEGLVRRTPDPADRRAKLLVRTPDGEATMDAIEAGVLERLGTRHGLSTEDQCLLRDLLTRLLAGSGPAGSAPASP